MVRFLFLFLVLVLIELAVVELVDGEFHAQRKLFSKSSSTYFCDKYIKLEMDVSDAYATRVDFTLTSNALDTWLAVGFPPFPSAYYRTPDHFSAQASAAHIFHAGMYAMVVEGAPGSRTLREMNVQESMGDCTSTPSTCMTAQSAANDHLSGDWTESTVGGELVIQFSRDINTGDSNDLEFLIADYVLKCWPLLLTIAIGVSTETNAFAATAHTFANSYVFFYDENQPADWTHSVSLSPTVLPDVVDDLWDTSLDHIQTSFTFVMDASTATVDVTVNATIAHMYPIDEFSDADALAMPWFGVAFMDTALFGRYATEPTAHETDYMVAATRDSSAQGTTVPEDCNTDVGWTTTWADAECYDCASFGPSTMADYVFSERFMRSSTYCQCKFDCIDYCMYDLPVQTHSDESFYMDSTGASLYGVNTVAHYKFTLVFESCGYEFNPREFQQCRPFTFGFAISHTRCWSYDNNDHDWNNDMKEHARDTSQTVEYASLAPSQPPTRAPSQPPSPAPSASPSQPPTSAPTSPAPSAAPSLPPTPAPSNEPTSAPTSRVCANVVDFDWDGLSSVHSAAVESASDGRITTVWSATALELYVEITLEYITRSKYTFVDQFDSDRGVTYVVDTAPFSSGERLLSAANNCENRNAASFDGLTDFQQYWTFLNAADGLNQESFVEYGPPGLWTLEWDTQCETVRYSRTFTLSQLLECSDGADAPTFAFEAAADFLHLRGHFYVTLVSPLRNQNEIDTDIGEYLTYALVDYPVTIAFANQIHSVRDPALLLFDFSVISVVLDEANAQLVISLLTYAADFVFLLNVLLTTPTAADFAAGTVSDITFLEDDSYAASECLFETEFRCFQKFRIEIALDACPIQTGIHLSSAIVLEIEPACRTNADCTVFTNEFGASGAKTALTDATFTYKESCDERVYTQVFDAQIAYFADAEFAVEVAAAHPFRIEDTIYIQASVSDTVNMEVFAIDVHDVWICSTNAANILAIESQLTGLGGCVDNAVIIDELVQVFSGGSAVGSELNAQIYEPGAGNLNALRFSLKIPAFQRSNFYVHTVIALSLSSNEGAPRRRRLLEFASAAALAGNRLSHYLSPVAIASDESADTGTEETDTDAADPDDSNRVHSANFFLLLSLSVVCVPVYFFRYLMI